VPQKSLGKKKVKPNGGTSGNGRLPSAVTADTRQTGPVCRVPSHLALGKEALFAECLCHSTQQTVKHSANLEIRQKMALDVQFCREQSSKHSANKLFAECYSRQS
jgi:hypothetical protein